MAGEAERSYCSPTNHAAPTCAMNSLKTCILARDPTYESVINPHAAATGPQFKVQTQIGSPLKVLILSIPRMHSRFLMQLKRCL